MKRLVPVSLMLVVACGGSDTVAPKPTPDDISSMKVGEVRVFKPSDIPEGLKLPSGSSARDYIVIVGNTNPTLDQKATYLVKADRSIGGSFQLSPVAEASTWPGGALDGTRVARTAQESFETKLRKFERSALALRSPSDPLGVSRFSLRKNVRAVLLNPVVGDRFNVNIPDADSADLCKSFIQTQAVIAWVSRKAIIAVDTLDGPPATLFTSAALDSISKEFDEITFPTDSSYFGDPTDVDLNGHIVILFTGRVNLLTKAGETGGFIGGFFFAGDFFPSTGPVGQSCAESNNGEIFYLLSPDPTGRFGNMRSTSAVRQATRGTIAHEFQHMINAGRRLQNPAVGAFEDVWLDEALAHFGEDAVGRRVKGFSDLQTVTFAEIVGSPGTPARDDFNAFFFQNFARLAYWMANPDTSSGISARADANLSSRGAAWALLRYSADNFSGDNPRAFTRKLVAGPGVGVGNLTSAARVPLDTLLAGWLVAEYADHLGISGLGPRYQYRSYNMRDVMPPIAGPVLNQNPASYPLKVTSIGTGTDNISGTNQLGTATYYRLNVAANAPSKNVKILDPGGTLATFLGAHIYVLRVQ